MTNRAREYREVIENLVASGTMDAWEKLELREMLDRVEATILEKLATQKMERDNDSN